MNEYKLGYWMAYLETLVRVNQSGYKVNNEIKKAIQIIEEELLKMEKAYQTDSTLN